jgi:hypothetical protein
MLQLPLIVTQGAQKGKAETHCLKHPMEEGGRQHKEHTLLDRYSKMETYIQ